jgi:hypothetical protein
MSKRDRDRRVSQLLLDPLRIAALGDVPAGERVTHAVRGHIGTTCTGTRGSCASKRRPSPGVSARRSTVALTHHRGPACSRTICPGAREIARSGFRGLLGPFEDVLGAELGRSTGIAERLVAQSFAGLFRRRARFRFAGSNPPLRFAGPTLFVGPRKVAPKVAPPRPEMAGSWGFSSWVPPAASIASCPPSSPSHFP